MIKRTIQFESRGDLCEGDLYLPPEMTKPPIIIMAHGFGTERTFGLELFIQRFVEEGWAAFCFDYRGFGGSTGEPRLLVSPQKHIEDLQAAIEFVRSLEDVDGNRVVLWGSSYGGGHCLSVAASREDIRGFVIQVPHVDAWSTMGKLGFRYILQAAWYGLLDLILPGGHMVKVVADPDEFGVMNTPESYPGYTGIVPDLEDWENQCRGRSLLLFATYRPVRAVGRINCPILVTAAEDDSLIDIHTLRQMAASSNQISLVELPVGHFAVYQGEWFEETIPHQVAFISNLLGQ